MENYLKKELVMFYNVENLFSPDPKPTHFLDPTISGLRNWDERKYQNKLRKIANVFRLIEEKEAVLPMIVGLCEVNNEEVLQDLIQQEPLQNYDFVHYNSLDERGVDTALLYDKRKIELVDSEAISFIFEGVNEEQDEYYDTTRDVLFCKLKYNDELLNVFVAHLPSKREKDVNKPKRDYILHSIKERVLTLLEKEEPVIICGDFNDDPIEENLNNLLYDNGVDKILVNPYIELYNNKIYSTFHYNQGLLFDQILFSNHFFLPISSLAFKSAVVFNSEKLSNWDKKFQGRPFRTFAGTRYLGGYSDHYPVYTILETKDN